ncbi:hypothetical protein EOL73_03965 [Candidatus Saccharibacteria bacterium]|nr:hypothetical protein [Candidatus Saccharibacteria bacterium]NCU40885.1 hypothetical protein [Candidatus Saccharibacteria bacterium]
MTEHELHISGPNPPGFDKIFHGNGPREITYRGYVFTVFPSETEPVEIGAERVRRRIDAVEDIVERADEFAANYGLSVDELASVLKSAADRINDEER